MKKITLLAVMVLCSITSVFASSLFTAAAPLCVADTIHDTIYDTVHDTVYVGVHDTVYLDTVTDTLYTAPDFKQLQVQVDAATPYGHVSGNGTFPQYSEVQIAAIANHGYRFLRWDDGNQENPRTIVLDGDRVYVALFDSVGRPPQDIPIGGTKDGEVRDTVRIVVHDTVRIEQHDTLWITPHDTLWVDTLTYCQLIVLSGSSEKGLVAGNGTFPVGTVVEIAAVPAEGCRFVHWHDRNRENPRRVTLDEIQIYVAEFAADTTSGEPVDPNPPEDPEEIWEAVVKYNVQGYDINITCPAHMVVRFFDASGRLLLASDPVGDKHTESVRSFRMSQGGLCMVQVGPFPVKKIMLMSAVR